MHKSSSSSLFQLIQSMNKDEKKHFKLFASYHTKDKRDMNYLRLFVLIEKQKKYDEEKIIKQHIVKSEHLKVLKHYLHHMILKSLQVMRGKGDDVDSKLSNMLEIARVMRDKSLEKEELKFLTKAVAFALYHERWTMALQALLQKRKVMNRREDKNMKEVDDVIAMTLLKLDNLHAYLKIHKEITSSFKRSEMQRGRLSKVLKKLMTDPLMNDLNKALSIEAKRLYFITLSQYYYYLGDYKKYYKLFLENVKLVENNLFALESPEMVYSSALNNLSIAQFFLKKYPELLETIEKQRHAIKKDKTAMLHAFMCTAINETNYYIAIGDFGKGMSVSVRIENDLEHIGSKLPYSQLVSVYFNMAYIYFGGGKYHRSLTWMNKIINYQQDDFREDLQAWAYILRVLIHYELNTSDILEHLIDNTYRFLHKREQLHKVEEKLLLFIQKLLKVDKMKKNIHLGFSKCRDEIMEIIKDPEEKKALHYFDLISWLESKIEDRPFAEIVKDKAME